MCRIDLSGQIGVKICSYGDRKFIKINPLNCPMGQFIRREDRREDRTRSHLDYERSAASEEIRSKVSVCHLLQYFNAKAMLASGPALP